MWLEKLEIQGFKSLATKNTLLFPTVSAGGRGLTAIVGPNGSGKSNIADAVRWVLGEQSLKTLRGKKSEDVIFAGSDKKSRLGAAEVSLYLRNDDDETLPNSEVVITRRLTRDGSGEYLINGARARLLDIELLLARANFGQKTYSVIGQGLVEGFLNMTPSERKEFFDEATGVKQFQIKRAEAVGKLQRSAENLGQVEMLAREIEPRLRSLDKQVARLNKRSELETALRATQTLYYGSLRWRHEADLSAANQIILILEKEQTDLTKKLATAQDSWRELMSQSGQADFVQHQTVLGAAENNLRDLTAKLEIVTAWLATTATVVADDQSERLDDLRRTIDETERQRTELARRSFVLRASLEQLPTNEIQRRELSAKLLERAAWEKALQKLEARLEIQLEVTGKFDQSLWLGERQRLESLLVAARERQTAAATELAERKGELARLTASEAELASRLTEARRDLQKILQIANQKKAGGEQLAIVVGRVIARLEILAGENDLTNLRREILAAKDELRTACALGAADASQLEDLRGQIENFNNQRVGYLEQLMDRRSAVAVWQAQAEQAEREISQVQRDLIAVTKKISDSQSDFDIDGGRAEAESLRGKLAVLSADIAERQNQLTALVEQISGQRNQLFAWQQDEQALTQQNTAAQTTLAQLLLQTARANTRQQDLTEQASKLLATELAGRRVELATMNELATVLTKNLQTQTILAEQARQKLDGFQAEQEARQTRLLAQQAAISDMQILANQQADKLGAAKTEAARADTRLQDLEHEARVEMDAWPRLESEPVDFVAEILTQQIATGKKQLALIGGIDPEAEADFVSVKARFEFLNTQAADLRAGITGLEQVIGELDSDTKERFDTGFAAIEKKFNQYFYRLFGGGSASLVRVGAQDAEIEDEAVVAEADEQQLQRLRKLNAIGLMGVEILATPPGKKIRSIAMLSGGERALTAIALICAIISVNPAPFVVLDEVDAALDEANSERLAAILADLSRQTQFIVITHNRASMRRANVLYGVTMGEDGVSKLISVKFAKDDTANA